MKIIGAIDIGSNAVRIICAHLTPDRRIKLVASVRAPLRLGLDVFKFGYLQESTICNYVELIEIFQKTLSQNKCEEIQAFGTSAFREADNADELISKIEKITRIQKNQKVILRQIETECIMVCKTCCNIKIYCDHHISNL